jgi:carnosine N-methyltransferase
MQKLETNLSPEILSKDPEEFKRFLIALDCMNTYIFQNKYQIEALKKDYPNLNKKYLSKMKYDYQTRIKRLEEAYSLNQIFLQKIAYVYKPNPSYLKNYNLQDIQNASYNESTTLNWAVFMYISRDWTKERKKERDTNYIPIINMVINYVKSGSNILIPGAALFRLGYELAKLGYNIDGNDYNFFNVILCDYLFNHSKKNEFSFQPFIRSFSNYLTEDAVFSKYSFPDEDISPNLEGKGKMTMIAGDFTKSYNDKKNYYDCVITCFFIDTAKNIFEYIDVIQKVIKEGGIWINFGPLSYHWIGYDNIPSIELPYDKLKEIIQNFGFEYINEELNKTVIYCEMEQSMKNDVFNCVFFTARKKEVNKFNECII